MASMDDSFPTILAVGNHGSLDDLIKSLQFDGNLVLMASDWQDAFRIIGIHSRPVHVLLTQDSVNGHGLAEALKTFRLDPTHVVQVNGNINAALEEVREHFGGPIAPPPLGEKGHAA
jgi:hypothetical protein